MTDPAERCLNCNRTSEQVPLLRLNYSNREYWICPQCLPILIHQPEKLPALNGAWIDNPIEHEGG